jgi:glycine/D-amino acid oxidase-like deaminating enzyme
MDLKSGYPFWAVKNGLMTPFPRLTAPLSVDALIVGGGITGALIATELKRAGLSTAVIEQREIGWGSTAASTALLQYEIDTELADLSQLVGKPDAVAAYLAGAEAVRQVLRLARTFRGVEAFPVVSLYYASRFWHEKRLRRDYDLRREAGLRLRLLERSGLADEFGIDAPVALLSKAAAVVDPYQLAYALFRRPARGGHPVFDRTRMAGFQSRRGGVTVELETGATVRCKHLILACGYEAQKLLEQSVAVNRSSYAFITDPQEANLGPLARTMVWESARPYLYLRPTADRRLLVGGEDDSIDIAVKRDAKVTRKAETLAKKAAALFPRLDWTPAFSWAGTFAETRDGLPFFGPHTQHGKRVHFAMAFGGNGITFAYLGAQILAQTLRGQDHPLRPLFSFERLKGK